MYEIEKVSRNIRFHRREIKGGGLSKL